MIAITGIPSESPVSLLTNSLDKLKLDYHLFNQRDIRYFNIEYALNNGRAEGFIEDAGCRLYLNDISGLYYRCMDYTEVPEYKQAIKRNSPIKDKSQQFYLLLNRLLQIWNNNRLVNKPFPMQSNNSKPYQSGIAITCGFDIPETLVTSNVDDALQFIQQQKKVIYKSISGVRSIVKQFTKQDEDELKKIEYCPVQFQELVTGFNVRVHVVGNKTFATRIHSDVIDYRYSGLENKTTTLTAFDLPDDIAEKCVALSKTLELNFSGIDLMFADDGRLICFEVNPSPGYSYYQANTGQLISDELALFLAGK